MKSSDDDEKENKLDKLDIKAKHEQPAEGIKTEIYDNFSRILFKRCTKPVEKKKQDKSLTGLGDETKYKTLYEEKVKQFDARKFEIENILTECSQVVAQSKDDIDKKTAEVNSLKVELTEEKKKAEAFAKESEETIKKQKQKLLALEKSKSNTQNDSTLKAIKSKVDTLEKDALENNVQLKGKVKELEAYKTTLSIRTTSYDSEIKTLKQKIDKQNTDFKEQRSMLNANFSKQAD